MGMSVGMSITEQVRIAQVQLHWLLSLLAHIPELLRPHFIVPPTFW